MISKTFKVVTLIYSIFSCTVSLIILTTAFESSNGKYVPAMIEANKFVFPLIISVMALLFAVFFEPESLTKKKVVVAFQTGFILILLLFSFFLLIQIKNNISLSLLVLYSTEEILIISLAVFLLLLRYKN